MLFPRPGRRQGIKIKKMIAQLRKINYDVQWSRPKLSAKMLKTKCQLLMRNAS